MRRLIATASILMAIASLTPLSASAVNCSQAPFNALPADVCKAIPNQGCRGPLPPEICLKLPPVARPPEMPSYVPVTGIGDPSIAVVNNTFTPGEVTVVVGQRLIFHNMDLGPHNVYYESCQTPEGRTCYEFAPFALDPSDYGPFANAILIAPNNFWPGQAYTYKCRLHNITGRFTVVAPN